MQDYRVHIKHLDGHFETIPYFCLPANDLNDVIAPSCYSCFDYTNAGADIVVGYMGTPYQSGVPMTDHFQYLVVRNARGKELLDSINGKLETSPPQSSGSRKAFVMQTVLADDEAKMGRGPKNGAPKLLGEILATVLSWVGPRGLEFAKYSIEYHYIRNYIHVMRHWGAQRAMRHVPGFAKSIVQEYDEHGKISQRSVTQLIVFCIRSFPRALGKCMNPNVSSHIYFSCFVSMQSIDESSFPWETPRRRVRRLTSAWLSGLRGGRFLARLSRSTSPPLPNSPQIPKQKKVHCS